MNLLRFYYTVKYLKPIQVRYQLYYRLRSPFHKISREINKKEDHRLGNPLVFSSLIKKNTSFNNYSFYFLNLTKTFSQGEVAWDYSSFGKLWNYNLNYFDFLLQEGMDKTTGLSLINHHIERASNQSVVFDPYPISLRNINWIKFCSINSIHDEKIDSAIQMQYQILQHRLEYHLMANHLLENGFSLLFGAFYFADDRQYQKAKKIVTSQLKEQILGDGGHFELSPMYHQLILDRLLDSINLLKNNNIFINQLDLLHFLEEKAKKMANWLMAITFSNGKIPLLNDSTINIAPSTEELINYANSLGIQPEAENNVLRESGYRRFQGNDYECVIDIGQIGASYQPGHAHADSLSFILNVYKKPFLIDPGVSTYENGSRRSLERGTAFHNTVTVKNKDSSEVWSAFRVGKRANVIIVKDENHSVTAFHDGYNKLNTKHQRKWDFEEKSIFIKDILEGSIHEGIANFVFHPDVEFLLDGNTIKSGFAELIFENPLTITINDESLPDGFNKYKPSKRVEVLFNQFLKTTIIITQQIN